MHPPAPAPYSPLRVFLVENHEDTLRLLRRLLERRGHVVRTATSKTEALATAPQGGFDVLVSDIGLGDGTGWELLEQLLLSGPVYAVAMSGYGSAEDRARSAKAGFKHHLLKPALTELAAILQKRHQELTVPHAA